MFLNSLGHSHKVPAALHSEPSNINFTGNSIFSAAVSFAVLSRVQQAVGSVVKSEMFELIDIMIRYGHNPDGIPALHYAIKMEDERAARLLLKHGTDPNSLSHHPVLNNHENPLLPLDYAAVSGNTNIIQLLIDYGANVNPNIIGIAFFEGRPVEIKREYGPLYFASKEGHLNAVRMLIAKGANVEPSPVYRGYNSPFYIAVKQGHFEVFRILFENCSSISYVISEPTYALHIAVLDGHIDLVKFLLQRGANLETRKDDMTPLMYASGSCVELLLNAGANPNAKTPWGTDALWFSAARFDIIGTKALLKRGIDINEVRHRETPFHIACVQGAVKQGGMGPSVKEYLLFLIENGANVNARDIEGRTALFYAKLHQNKGLIDFLIAHGAKD